MLFIFVVDVVNFDLTLKGHSNDDSPCALNKYIMIVQYDSWVEHDFPTLTNAGFAFLTSYMQSFGLVITSMNILLND